MDDAWMMFGIRAPLPLVTLGECCNDNIELIDDLFPSHVVVEDASELFYYDSSPLYYDYDFTGSGGSGAITLNVIGGVCCKYYRYW
jgi:hypothetical protein